MNSLVNEARPPVFCPGCAHERVVYALDQAFINLGLAGNRIVMVSDIGCSGLFDTFFHTHAFHGLHGRALTYAAGIKLARPELNVVVTMGDGGLGIGGQHVLSACRRNLNLTLLVLNNFNFGMTGGQFSATTPPEAVVGSGFLNRLEKPFDVRQVCAAAGAGYVASVSAYRKNLPEAIQQALEYEGFSVLEIQGVCPGRYTKRNKLTPGMIDQALAEAETTNGPVPQNQRPEYGRSYRELSAAAPPAREPLSVEPLLAAPFTGQRAVALLGSAGQRILTAGELLGLAGLAAGLKVTQKNDYDITVLRGPSVAELILSAQPIDFTGTGRPDAVAALAPEGVQRRRGLFGLIGPDGLILQAADVDLPPSNARTLTLDFKAQGIKGVDRALAALAALAKLNHILTLDMLETALKLRFKGPALETALELVHKVEI
ncbi:MAG: thiamine pyrophosphate-dependent enzyme [Thermodesulfobacteriota bacterium]